MTIRHRILLQSSALSLVMAVCAAIAPQARAADEAATSATIGEVVVTAQRRAENLVDVPISVGVVSGAALKNANYSNLTDLQFLEPAVTYNTNFGGGFEIRGVGTQSVTASVEQSVSVVVDDVVHGLPELSFAGPSYQALTDIERVEVLRGPQGTLFGKNSSAGVLQVVTKRPILNEFSGDTSTSYGTDNEVKVAADLNVPIGSTAALRLAGFTNSRDGYINNLYTHQEIGGYDNAGVRAKFLWQPNERAEVYIIGSYVRDHDTGNGIWTLRSCGSGFKGGLGVFSACATDAPYGVVPGPTNLSGAWDGLNGVVSRATEWSGRVNYDLGAGVTFKSITSFQRILIDEDVEVDSSPLPILSVNHSRFNESEFTQEFRLDGKIGDKLDFTTGLFYYHTNVYYGGVQAGTYNYLPATSPVLLTSGVGGPTPCCISVENTSTDSEAAFGQVSYHVTDALVVLGGLRYTDDSNALTNQTFDGAGLCQFAFALGAACKPAVLPSVPLYKKVSADKLTGKLTVQYYITPPVNVYATFSTGEKGPSVSYPRGLPLVGVLPETSTNYEAGVKGNLLQGKLYLDADVFYTKYTNFQGQALYVDPSNPANRAYLTTNAGGLTTRGAEGQVTFRATPEFTLNAAAAYVPTKFISFAIPCNDAYTNPATTPGKCTYLNPNVVNPTPQFNAAGYPLTYAPKWTYSLSAAWQHDLSMGGQVAVNVNYHYQSSTYTVVADPNSITPGYGLMGANISYAPTGGKWKVSLFSRNLLNKYFVTGIFKTSLDGGAAGTTPLSTIGYSNIPSIESKRTVGVKLDVNF